MHGNFPIARLRSNPISPRTRTKNIQALPLVFADVARLAYPIKTLESLGAVTGCSRSALATYLNGQRDAPAWVLAIVLGEVMRRLATR